MALGLQHLPWALGDITNHHCFSGSSKPRLSLEPFSMQESREGLVMIELAGRLNPLAHPCPVPSASALQRRSCWGSNMLPVSSWFRHGCSLVGCTSPKMPWKRFLGSFTVCIGFQTPSLISAPLSEISFPPVPLDSLELRALSSAWTLRGFAHTLAHPLGTTPWLFPLLNWLSVLTSVLMACPHPLLSCTSSPGTMTVGPSSLSNQTSGPALLLPCAWLASDLIDYPASLIAGHPGISHQHSF